MPYYPPNNSGGGELPDTYSGDVSEAIVVAENPENSEEISTFTLKEFLIQALHSNPEYFGGEIDDVRGEIYDVKYGIMGILGRLSDLESGGGGGEVQDTGYQNLELPDLPGLSEDSNITIRRVGNQVYVHGALSWTEPTTMGGITDELEGYAYVSPIIPQGYTPDNLLHNSGYAFFIDQQNPYIRKAGAVNLRSTMTIDGNETIVESQVDVTPIQGLTTFQIIGYGISWFTADPFPST